MLGHQLTLDQRLKDKADSRQVSALSSLLRVGIGLQYDRSQDRQYDKEVESEDDASS